LPTRKGQALRLCRFYDRHRRTKRQRRKTRPTRMAPSVTACAMA
jgi:hypothetical protein